MKSWFSITNKAEAPAAEVLIFDEIGLWGITARDFATALASVPVDREITLGINSPGGEVFQGWAIYNLMQSRREKITVRIDGVAASIAAVIAMGGKKVIMPPASLLMIHNASGGNWGESEDLRKTAEILDKINAQCVTIFAQKTGKSEDEIRALMPANKDTWMSPAEAKEYGFCDEISGGSAATAVASFDFRRFKNGPKPVEGAGENQPEETPPTPAKPTMKSLLVALAAAGLIPSADATEDVAVSTFQKNFAPIKAASDEATAMRAQLTKAREGAAETFIAQAIADGKIKDDEKAKKNLKEAYMANEESTRALIGDMQAPKRGATHVPTQRDGNTADEGTENSVESIRAKLETETDPVQRGFLARQLREARGHKDLFGAN